MKYKKYISTAFLAVLLLPLLSAKSTSSNVEGFDVSTIKFIEEEQQIELGFDTNDYLPEGFNPYKEEVPVSGINFMEEENTDLGFDTSEFLPEDFNAYER
ncbi:hypothetical protein [uncultured Croceitalea sp.]|uniref:hypothetical protein n=1 Tax=uncultured Croceitalea sp. TaxID=1798908 RepID=UPI003305EE12